MKRGIYTLTLIILTIVSCKKEITEPRGGIFRGTFTKTILNGGKFTGDCTLALNEQQLSFILSVDTTSDVPYNCRGTYSVLDVTKIKFYSSYLAPNGGDQNIILDSVYTYFFDDVRFDLTKQIDTITYEFNFIRY